MNIPNTAQSAQTFSHRHRSMKRVGVAKLPLSMPAANASIAAPEDPIIRLAIGAIMFRFRRETCIPGTALPCQCMRDSESARLFVEARLRYVIFLNSPLLRGASWARGGRGSAGIGCGEGHWKRYCFALREGRSKGNCRRHQS